MMEKDGNVCREQIQGKTTDWKNMVETICRNFR